MKCCTVILSALSLLLLAPAAHATSWGGHNSGYKVTGSRVQQCSLKPLGAGHDDTDQILSAIAKCGKGGATTFAPGQYNITRKMTWELSHSTVDLHGYLSFVPDIQYWLQANNTYRVVNIQNQASWFVLTGSDFTVDAHSTGGINGNGQPWWSYFANRTRADGDGRPISLTLKNVTRGTVKGFRIEAPPFWANTAADSDGVVYDGMYVNATNQDPLYAGKNIVPNTDGIDTYRSNNVTLLNWDITCGDDALAIKGNSTNIFIQDVIVRGGNGIAFGSLGQYQQFNDIVENVTMANVQLVRLAASVQPGLKNGVYLKTWTGSVSGTPPTGGGGGGGYVRHVTLRNFTLGGVDIPFHLYQTNGGHSADTPSSIQFSNLTISDWRGTSTANKLVDIECSANAPCDDISFSNWNVTGPTGTSPRYICIQTLDVTGTPGPCNSTGNP